MSIKVTCQVQSYDNPAKPSLFIKSDWCESSKVILEWDGKELTVVANDLIAAVQNATNINS